MLKHSRISKYKIKKILKCFADDFAAVEAQKIVKLNIRTVERYYNIFRKIMDAIAGELVFKYNFEASYIGWTEGTYCRDVYLDIFRYGKRFYLPNILQERPKHEMRALTDKYFSEFAVFFYTRAKKFYGFSKKNYNSQLIENSVRWYFNDSEKLFKVIYERLS